MNGLAQSVVLMLIGSVVLRISISDVYLRYVKEGLRPYLVVAGILLVVMAVFTGWRELRDDPEKDSELAHAAAAGDRHADGLGHTEGHTEDLADGHGDGHGHSHNPMIAWLLMLPIFAIFLIAPPALGSYAASRAGSAAVTKRTEFAPLPSGKGPIALSTVDYATRAIWEDGVSMKGRTIRLTGFLSPRSGGGFYLTRIILSCCAADGRPLKIGLTGNVPEGLKADDWIQVDGTYSPKTDRDPVMRDTIAYIDVTGHERVTPPDEQYEQ